MIGHLIKCLLAFLVISFLLVTLVFATIDSNSHADDDPEDSEHKQFYQTIDKSDWVDYGDIFTFDPLTKSNREPNGEPKLKEVAANIIKKARERKQVDKDDQQDYCYHDCSELSVKLRNCEAAQKQSQCDCSFSDDCGKRSYQIIRRLMLILDKQLRKKYFKGSILELKVNLDDILFKMPEDINNSSDCDYLGYLHPLFDQILPSIVVYHPEPYKSGEYLYHSFLSLTSFKTVTTGVGVLILIISWYKFSPRLKLISLILAFLVIICIWEYIHLYETRKATVEEKVNRLRDKCESQAQSNWFGWISTMIPDLAFRNEVSECTDYYITTRVDPLLSVNPVMAVSKVYEVTILYAIRLTANAGGAAFKAFFSHIPTFWTPFVMIAGVVIVIYFIKYLFMFKTPAKKSKPTKQKPSIREDIPKPAKLTSSKTKGLRQRIDTKKKKSKIEFTLKRYGSTGNIQKLYLL